MDDSIINCVVYKNQEGAIQGYNVTFSFDGADVPLAARTIYIGNFMLLNPRDLKEVKKIACQQAKATKILYSNATEIEDLNGKVSL